VSTTLSLVTFVRVARTVLELDRKPAAELAQINLAQVDAQRGADPFRPRRHQRFDCPYTPACRVGSSRETSSIRLRARDY